LWVEGGWNQIDDRWERIAAAFGTILDALRMMGFIAVGRHIHAVLHAKGNCRPVRYPRISFWQLIALAKEHRSSMSAHIAASNPDDKKQLDAKIAALDRRSYPGCGV